MKKSILVLLVLLLSACAFALVSNVYPVAATETGNTANANGLDPLPADGFIKPPISPMGPGSGGGQGP
jgi:hypothetical protein